jgi:hypothetical protein
VTTRVIVTVLAAGCTGAQSGDEGAMGGGHGGTNSYVPAPGATDPAVHRGAPPDDPRAIGGGTDDAGAPDGGAEGPADPNPRAYELCLVLVAFERDLHADDAYRNAVCSAVGSFDAESFGGGSAICERERDECLERGGVGAHRDAPECYTDWLAPCDATTDAFAACLEAIATASRDALDGVTCETGSLDLRFHAPPACRALHDCTEWEDDEGIYPYGVYRVGSSTTGPPPPMDAGVP